VRFGFLGGLSKHKGLHVLLDAWSQLDAPAHLEIHGDSTDRAYVAAMEARASELGVAWRGAFEQRDLPRVLGGIDVVVVPSIWLENAPFVIREGVRGEAAGDRVAHRGARRERARRRRRSVVRARRRRANSRACCGGARPSAS
jgi:glycosyltransferase involved in cell wall biosynthesis